MSGTQPALAEIDDKRFFGHPMGLAVLFFAEMWERFSYYGMRALLTLYLTKHWLFSDDGASGIYGAYTALVYITPVLGGYLADRYLGQRKAVAFGAILLTIGHALMAFEGEGGTDNPLIYVFWLALAFIIVGTGFLKANISVIVGQLYQRTDVRRDSAYTIFYMGINLGAALGAIICGYLGETIGWKYGFGAAGIGMLLGLVVFTWGRPLFFGRGESPAPEKLVEKVGGFRFEHMLYALGVASVLVCWVLIQFQSVVGWLLGIAGLILALYVVLTAVITLSREDRDRIFAAMFLIFGSIMFWALFEQAGSSLNLLTDRMVNRSFFGINVPASTFQSINAIYIVLLAPVLAALWTWLGRRKLEPSAPAKFGLAMMQLGAGFLVLVWGAKQAGLGEEFTPVIYIFLIYLLHTTGELCLSPVGLSAMNRLAPAKLASLIMGTWFFASAAGNFAAGQIARATGATALEEKDTSAEVESGDAATKILADADEVSDDATSEVAAEVAGDAAMAPETEDSDSDDGEEEEPKQMVPGSDEAKAYMGTITSVYTKCGWAAVFFGVFVLAVSPLVKWLMHLDTLKDGDEDEEEGDSNA